MSNFTSYGPAFSQTEPREALLHDAACCGAPLRTQRLSLWFSPIDSRFFPRLNLILEDLRTSKVLEAKTPEGDAHSPNFLPRR